MITRFHIYAKTGSARSYLAKRNTFDDAEQYARDHAAANRTRVEVDVVVTTSTHRTVKPVATVSQDSLGRVWTDLTWHSTTLV